MTWKTLGGEPSLDEAEATRLLDMLPVLARRVRCQLLEIAVLSNHVHVVASLPEPMPMSLLAQRLKGASSRLLNLQRAKRMKWAHGYHVKTISREALHVVRRYLDGQSDKHRLPWVKRWCYGMQVPVTCMDEPSEVVV
jgi:REP element-mobilizing transposase RayT